MNRNRNVAYESDKKVLEIAKINVLNRIRFDIKQCLKEQDDLIMSSSTCNENILKIKIKEITKRSNKVEKIQYNENREDTIDTYINKISEFLKEINNIEFIEDIDFDLISLYFVSILKSYDKERITEIEFSILDNYYIYKLYIQEIQKFKTLIL